MRPTASFNLIFLLRTFILTNTILLAACGVSGNRDKSSETQQPDTPSETTKDKKQHSQRNLRRLSSTEIAAIKPIEKKTGRFAECGVESYNLRAEPLCGVQEFHLRSSQACTPIVREDAQFGILAYRTSRGEACGVEEYFSKPDESCGVDEETFWSGWDESCPAGYAAGSWYSALKNTEMRVHKISWSDIRTQTRHLCQRRTPKTCARPEFGVKLYKSCAHADFGVEKYNSGTVGYEACRHESHGVESYNSCRHETFGVEKYKSCSLYMTQQETDGYLKAQADVLPALNSTLLDSAAIYYSAAGKQRALACLVKSIIEDPKQTELAEDLKNRYFILTDRFWSEEEAQQCDKGFVDIESAESACQSDNTSISCTSFKTFKNVRSAMLTTRKNLTLLSEEALERGQKETSEALSALLKTPSH